MEPVQAMRIEAEALKEGRVLVYQCLVNVQAQVKNPIGCLRNETNVRDQRSGTMVSDQGLVYN